MRSRHIALAAGLAALTAAGCGEQKIDVTKSKGAIQQSVENQAGVKVKSIDCPDKVNVKARATFTCLVTGADGTKGVATVTQIDGKGTISVTPPFLSNLAAEQTIQTDLRTRSPRATVQCPDIIVLKAGAKFTCHANLGEINALVNATQTNARGNFRYNVKSVQ